MVSKKVFEEYYVGILGWPLEVIRGNGIHEAILQGILGRFSNGTFRKLPERICWKMSEAILRQNPKEFSGRIWKENFEGISKSILERFPWGIPGTKSLEKFLKKSVENFPKESLEELWSLESFLEYLISERLRMGKKSRRNFWSNPCKYFLKKSLENFWKNH